MSEHDPTQPPVEWYDPHPGMRRWWIRKRVGEQNHSAALNGLGYPPIEAGNYIINVPVKVRVGAPPISKVSPPPYGYTRSGARRRARGIWRPVTLILCSLAVLYGVCASCDHFPESGKMVESNSLPVILSEEAPDLVVSPPANDSANHQSPIDTGASSSAADPYMHNLRVTWYGPPDFPETSGVCRGGSIRSWMDRAADLGLDGICAAGDVDGTTWYEDAKHADPPIALCVSEAGTFLLVDRMRRDLQRVDIWRESDPPWPDHQNVWEVEYPTSTVESEAE